MTVDVESDSTPIRVFLNTIFISLDLSSLKELDGAI